MKLHMYMYVRISIHAYGNSYKYIQLHVDQGRDAICLVQTLKIRPAQLSCLGGSAGRAVCLERRTSWVRVPPEPALLFLLGKKELSSGVVACICLVSCTCTFSILMCFMYYTECVYSVIARQSNYTRKQLFFTWKNTCKPHAPKVGSESTTYCIPCSRSSN